MTKYKASSSLLWTQSFSFSNLSPIVTEKYAKKICLKSDLFFFILMGLYMDSLKSGIPLKRDNLFWKFQVFEEDGCENPASPNSNSPQSNLQVPQNHHGDQFVATDPPHWQSCRHHEMPQESRHLCRSCIEIHVKLPISLLYDGVLDGCVADLQWIRVWGSVWVWGFWLKLMELIWSFLIDGIKFAVIESQVEG